MILPEFILTTRQNYKDGLDSLKKCLDKNYFKSYPYIVEYVFNSRGFRDAEWPDTLEELQDSIWCVGDSFTVGLGSPITHTWPNILQSNTNKRCINVSMDGASNKWIARKVLEIIKTIHPKIIVIQWSYIPRDELCDSTLTDEDRRIDVAKNKNIDELRLISLKLIQDIEFQKDQCKIIHSFVPYGTLLDRSYNENIWECLWKNNWPSLPDTLNEFNCLEKNIVNELKNFNVYDVLYVYYQLIDSIMYVPEIKSLDLARDGHHYDIITATNFVDQVENLIFDLRLS